MREHFKYINAWLSSFDPPKFGSKQVYSGPHVGAAWVARVWDCLISHTHCSRPALILSFRQQQQRRDEMSPTRHTPKMVVRSTETVNPYDIRKSVILASWIVLRHGMQARHQIGVENPSEGACVIYCLGAWSLHVVTAPLRFVLTSEEHVHKDKAERIGMYFDSFDM